MAENTKENLLKAPYVYYISNPKVPELYCLAVPMYVDLSEAIANYELPNWHTEAPDKSLVNPVWSLDVNGWVEADGNSQGALIAKQAKVIEDLQKTSAEKDQAITELQRTLQQSSLTTGQLSAQFNQFGSSVTKALQDVTTAVNELKKEGDK